MGQMTECPNCGAQIDKEVTKCPYCGFINAEGAEKKYRKDLEEVRENIRKTRKEPSRALVKGIAGGTRTIFIILGVLILLAVVYVAELLRETRDKPKLFLTDEEQAYAAAYTEIAGEELSRAYEDGDIEKMADIFDKAYSQDRISIWGAPHYETAYAASRYRILRQTLAGLDGGKISKKEAEEITYDCFYFYYRAYGEDGAELFDPIREEEILPIIWDRLGYTEEDMERFRDEVFTSSNVNRSRVYKATRKYYRNYH
ncbi:MAG: zinc-ribbon domain-containing protein [Lachnospiraceae bacterium]|nr:zinc-ribbon domain-containing protein [Lachnospiraceae bacterium]